MAQGVPLLGTLLGTLARFRAGIAGFVLLLLAYKLMPNTHVRFRPAAWGAAVAAILWALSRWGFGLYVGKALPYMKLYGALGLIPLFLFWLYLTWLIVLFGMELAYTLQAMKGRDVRPAGEARRRERGQPPVAGPDDDRDRPRVRSGATPESPGPGRGAPGPPASTWRSSPTGSRRKRLVHQVQPRGSGDMALTLALPPEAIPLTRLVDLGARLSIGPSRRTGPGWRFLATMQEAARTAAGEQTLAALVEPGSASSPHVAED